MKKKNKKEIYKIKNKSELIREELGLSYIVEKDLSPIDIKKYEHPKTTIFNDIDLNNWKDYGDIITDSLWLLGSRDKSGAHSGEYHGNFIPQIPHQAIMRYTKKKEIVLDTFLGSGTTLIECKRLGRNGIGIELLPNMVKRAKELISQEQNPFKVKTDIIEGDNTVFETIEKVKKTLRQNYNAEKVQLIIMHPPYHDIIKFSDNPNDLCNAKTTDEFLSKFSQVVKNTYPLLDEKRFLVLIIGDKYSQSEWVPLSFYTMQKVLENGYKLKSIVIKNISGNRAKRNAEQLWRRRALGGGFYIFKHEYIMFFQKR
ncbi:MAG: DNA methylase [Elusimicrobia bacterium ADurb.Bin231]|nr:MAG: DNA methylase [Elusimicrobia bacterium ADurb.Bin231]